MPATGGRRSRIHGVRTALPLALALLAPDAAGAEAPGPEPDRPGAATPGPEPERAGAETAPPAPPAAAGSATRGPELLTERRAVPDYDGRPEVPDESDSVGIWALRVIFFPAYLVSEYVVRRPLGWATIAAERANLYTWVIDVFTFGPERNAMLFPTALIDFGFEPSVGLYFAWRDAFVDDNTLTLQAGTWGPGWLRLTFSDSYEFRPGSEIGLRLEGWRRPDWLFFGLGPRSLDEDWSRYGRIDLSGTLSVDVELPRTSWFTAHAGVSSRRFEHESCCGPPIRRRVANGVYPLPPGFEEGYDVYRQGLWLALDTRRPRPAAGSGVRAVARVERNIRLGGDGPDQWLHYSGALSGFWDVTGHNRTIGLSVAALFADPIGSTEDIPFTDQVVLGGNAPMRGFLEGRLIDRSALVSRLQYTWPVWVLVDGSLAAEAGNVFGERLSNFDPGLVRLSFTLGLRAHGRRDRPFEALIGFGTTPLDEGAKLDSIRLLLGATNGF